MQGFFAFMPDYPNKHLVVFMVEFYPKFPHSTPSESLLARHPSPGLHPGLFTFNRLRGCCMAITNDV
jgi:hypothetical protein